jgi:hypothetical protein
MGLFDRLGDFLEEREEEEEREEWRECREEYFEEEWELEGSYFDPYRHGELFFDPGYGHHGVIYNGVWHPVEYVDGSWVFVHPRRYGVPRYYRPGNLMPPRQAGYGTTYGQGGNFGQQSGVGAPSDSSRPVSEPQAGAITCSRCQASQPAGTHFCQSCGNDLSVKATAATTSKYCSSCGAVLAATANFCGACGRAQV